MLWRQPVEGASVFLAALQFPADCLPSRRFSLLGLSSVPSTKHHTPSFVNAGLKKKESVTYGRTRGKKIMARFSFSIFPNSGGKIMECLPWILCWFGCDEERVSWRQKSVFCLIIAIFNHREICSSWRFCIIPFFPPLQSVMCTNPVVSRTKHGLEGHGKESSCGSEDRPEWYAASPHSSSSQRRLGDLKPAKVLGVIAAWILVLCRISEAPFHPGQKA